MNILFRGFFFGIGSLIGLWLILDIFKLTEMEEEKGDNFDQKSPQRKRKNGMPKIFLGILLAIARSYFFLWLFLNHEKVAAFFQNIVMFP